MDVFIEKSSLRGEIAAIPSKSDAHRALICAALSDAPCRIDLPALSEDTEATLDCLRAMGAEITREGELLAVMPVPRGEIPPATELRCRESGSTLRFLLPVAAALCTDARFTGEGRLPQRPLEPILQNFMTHGVQTSLPKLPFTLYGRLRPGVFHLPGNCSSQFLSGLFFALPLLKGDSEIYIEGKLESAGYAEMTLHTQRRFGVHVEAHDARFCVPGAQRYTAPKRYAVEGDWSSSAFFLAAGALGGSVTVSGLDADSAQPDRVFEKLYARLGGRIDVSACPDLFPILAVCAAFHPGATRFEGCARLRIKESDRIAAMERALSAMGVKTETREAGMTVFGGGALHGAVIDGMNDHRIVMAMSIAGSMTGDLRICGAEAVRKSYPDFFSDFTKLGGKYHVL